MKINKNTVVSSTFSRVKTIYPSSKLPYVITPTMRIPPKGYIWSVLQGKFIKALQE